MSASTNPSHAEDQGLHYLLASVLGQDWLEEEFLRRALHRLAEKDDFFHEACRKAITQLESHDLNAVLAGLDTIVAYFSLCPVLQERMHQSLVGLLENRADARIIERVKVVLEHTGHPGRPSAPE